MSAVWLLSTRGRPQACQRVLDACVETGMSSRGLVYVDGTFEEYEDLRLPENWRIHRSRTWGSIAASMRYCLKRYPDATQYGWLADDNIPRTPGWDVILEQEAGDWFISFARDLWLSEFGWLHQTGGPCFTSGLCWGGDLIRSVGWWSLPGLLQGGIDGAWNDLAGLCGLSRYVPEVVIEHLTWKLDKRPHDATDEWVKYERDYITDDLERYYEWTREGRAEVAARITSELNLRSIRPRKYKRRMTPRSSPTRTRSTGLLR